MKTKIAVIISIITAVLFQPGCGSGSESARKDAGSNEAISVPRMKVTLSSLEDFYEATGTVQAKTTTQVSANIMGRITSLPFSEGDVVSRGQVLIQIDNSENKTRYDKAVAGLKEAQAAIVEIDRSAVAARLAFIPHLTEAARLIFARFAFRLPIAHRLPNDLGWSRIFAGFDRRPDIRHLLMGERDADFLNVGHWRTPCEFMAYIASKGAINPLIAKAEHEESLLRPEII